MELHTIFLIFWLATGLNMTKLLIEETIRTIKEKTLTKKDIYFIWTVTFIASIIYTLFGPIILAIQFLNFYTNKS